MTSVLAASAAARVTVTAVVVAALWLAVAWALQ